MIRILIKFYIVFILFSCGDDCGDPQNLKSMRIEGITLRSFPNEKPNGDQWDQSLFESEFPADPILTISVGNETVAGTDIYMPNIISPFEAEYDVWYTVEQVDLKLTISVWDKDEEEDEFMASVEAFPRDIYEVAGCTSKYLFSNDDCEIEIEVSYEEEM